MTENVRQKYGVSFHARKVDDDLNRKDRKHFSVIHLSVIYIFVSFPLYNAGLSGRPSFPKARWRA
jgi:hypothetical protein